LSREAFASKFLHLGFNPWILFAYVLLAYNLEKGNSYTKKEKMG
jgi:hypothetical protein